VVGKTGPLPAEAHHARRAAGYFGRRAFDRSTTPSHHLAMPTSKKRTKKKPSSGTRARDNVVDLRPPGASSPLEAIVQALVGIGPTLLAFQDPLDAEMLTSSTLGIVYKTLGLDHQRLIEARLGIEILEAVALRGHDGSLALLRALTVVGDENIARLARVGADELAERGLPDPSWADIIGSPALVEAWSANDHYGDQTGYYAIFRYAGREPHVVTALYDENMGGIIKDATCSLRPPDLRAWMERDDEAIVQDVDPGVMARRVLSAIETGDRYVDNDWTEDFRDTRGLLRARMRSLPVAAQERSRKPLSMTARKALIKKFRASAFAPKVKFPTSILEYCLDARCDFGDGDPVRWSPIVVEMFMLDCLVKKVILDASEIRAVPDVLRAWVRFALTERGLEERWIEPAVEAVGRFTPEFKRAVTDHANFGPSKAITNAMLAAGIDLEDQEALNRWVADFNARPFEERDAFFGGPIRDR
jgi:hypothetical protein